MSRTQKRYSSDQHMPDGHTFISALDATYTSGTVTPTTDTNPGVYSEHVGNTQTVVAVFPLSLMTFRTGMNDDLQEQFGSLLAGPSMGGATGLSTPGFTTYITTNASAGSAVSIAVQSSAGFVVNQSVQIGGATPETAVITAIADATHITANLALSHLANSFVSANLFTTPAGVSGPPPFTGVTEFTPVTVPRPKGIRIKTLYPWYAIGGATATTNTIGAYQTVAQQNTAPAVTTLVAATAIPATVQTQPWLPAVSIPTPPWLTTKFASYNLQWSLTTTGAGTAVLYGIFMDFDYNYA